VTRSGSRPALTSGPGGGEVVLFQPERLADPAAAEFHRWLGGVRPLPDRERGRRAALRLLEKFEAGELPVFLADGPLPEQDAMTGANTTIARASNIRRGVEGAQSNDEADPRAQSVGE
jgi:hypothetical protein